MQGAFNCSGGDDVNVRTEMLLIDPHRVATVKRLYGRHHMNLAA
jgi:hypothetical protein